MLTQVRVLEAASRELARAVADHDGVGLGQRLQPRRQVGRVAKREPLVSCPPTNVADHHHPGVDADAQRQPCRRIVRQTLLRFAHPGDDSETGAYRPLSVVLVGDWVAEVNQEPITQVLGDVAPEALDDPCRGLLVSADDGTQFLRIEPFRQCRRAHQVAEHHRQLAAFAFGGCRGDGGGGGWRRERFGCGGERSQLGAIELDDGLQEHLAMPQRLHAELPKILIRQGQEKIRCDVVVLERVGILRQPELREPRSDVVHEMTSTLRCRARLQAALAWVKDSERRRMPRSCPSIGLVRIARAALREVP
jgi:hypothetical protein